VSPFLFLGSPPFTFTRAAIQPCVVFVDNEVLCSPPFDDNHVIVDFNFNPIHVSLLG
jgi:hypothetical protein